MDWSFEEHVKDMEASEWQSRAEAAEATLASCNRARQAAEAECERLRAALENAEAERDDYWSVLDEIADGVADPEWTAREALGRNDE